MRKNKANGNRSFAERHPKWNLVLGIVTLLALAGLAGYVAFEIIYYIGLGLYKAISLLSSIASKLDAVVIVALITGAVSIIGVIISSIISKSIDYKKARREYLAQKREAPYGEFVEMIYKVQQSSKDGHKYPQEDMIKDLTSFSKQITLWGSPAVVNNWVKFKENATKQTDGIDNLLLTEKIMNAMRKDLGLKKVKKGNLLAFFINDIKDAMKKVNK